MGIMAQSNMLCSPVDTYPCVFLELLSSVRAALIPPLWSILRIKVKEPFSEGKLIEKQREQRQRWGWEARNHGGKRVKCWLDGGGGRRVVCPGANNRADSAGFSPRIYFKERSAEINCNKSPRRPNEMQHPELPPAADKSPPNALEAPGSILKIYNFKARLQTQKSLFMKDSFCLSLPGYCICFPKGSYCINIYTYMPTPDVAPPHDGLLE